MTRLVRITFVAAALAVLGLAGQARADFLVTVTSTVTTPSGTGTSETATGANGSSVTLAQFLDAPGDAQLGTAAEPIHITYGSTVTTPTSTGTDTYSLPFTWTLTFTSATGSASASSTWIYNGILTTNASTLAASFTGGGELNSSTYTAIALGGRTIFVKLDPSTPPGTPPDTKNDFSVSLYLAPVPEPGTIALLGVGGLVLLAPVLRRRVRGISSTA